MRIFLKNSHIVLVLRVLWRTLLKSNLYFFRHHCAFQEKSQYGILPGWTFLSKGGQKLSLIYLPNVIWLIFLLIVQWTFVVKGLALEGKKMKRLFDQYALYINYLQTLKQFWHGNCFILHQKKNKCRLKYHGHDWPTAKVTQEGNPPSFFSP